MMELKLSNTFEMSSDSSLVKTFVHCQGKQTSG